MASPLSCLFLLVGCLAACLLRRWLRESAVAWSLALVAQWPCRMVVWFVGSWLLHGRFSFLLGAPRSINMNVLAKVKSLILDIFKKIEFNLRGFGQF